MKRTLLVIVVVFLTVFHFSRCGEQLLEPEEKSEEELYLVETTTAKAEYKEIPIDYKELYDSHGDDNEEEIVEDEQATEDEPYNCPAQCKCLFRKRNASSVEHDEEIVEEEETTKYDIDVDCSGQSLSSIRNLFDEEFPLDQIVSLNMSNNRFRLLKLDDGFEDMIGLVRLDLSSNPNLRSLSPKGFLKKFRQLKHIHLNDLNQTNCLSDKLTGNYISIDCRWYKTLAYLFKRNVTVHMAWPFVCDTAKLMQSVSIISKCDEYLIDAARTKLEDLVAKSQSTTSSSSALNTFELDEMRFVQKIEPDLNQLLIEGDRLELTCKLTRLVDNGLRSAKSRAFLNSELNFYRSRLRWFLNGKPLFSSPPSRDNYNLTSINIYLTKHKTRTENILESKLIIINAKSTMNTGQYSCMITNLMNNEQNTVLNGSKVDIRIMSRQELRTMESKLLPANSNNNNNRMTVAKVKKYCTEMITQTYKGVYKWPRTAENTRAKLKCSYQPNGAERFATYECTSNGQWSEKLELAECEYTSNLTRYLFKISSEAQTRLAGLLKSNQQDEIKLHSLDEIIHQMVSLQSSNSTTKSTADKFYAKDTHQSSTLNMYDIIFMQRYLNVYYTLANRSLSSTAKRQFMWLNDIVSRLSPNSLHMAQSLDSFTFSNYFFESLIPLIQAEKMGSKRSEETTAAADDDYYYDELAEQPRKEQIDVDDSSLLLSSYLALTTSLNRHVKFPVVAGLRADSKMVGRYVCHLNKYQMSQQFYFKCSFNQPRKELVQTNFEADIGLIDVYHNRSDRILFILFDDDRLIPSRRALNESFSIFKYKPQLSKINGLNLISELNDEHDTDPDPYEILNDASPKCVSQVFAINYQPREAKLNGSFRLNLTLEIKMPQLFFKLFSRIEQKLINQSMNLIKSNGSMNFTESKAVKNPFDAVFQSTNQDQEYEELKSRANDSIYDRLMQDERFLRSFRFSLITKWFNQKRYQIMIGTRSETKVNKLNVSIVDWKNQPESLNLIKQCRLKLLQQNFWLNLSNLTSLKANNDFRLFASLECDLHIHNPNISTEYICLTHADQSDLRQVNDSPIVVSMLDKYATFNRLTITLDTDSGLSFVDQLVALFSSKYKLFKSKVVYLSLLISALLLFMSIIFYIIARKRLMMPRSFYHSYINIWICVLLLILIYLIGILQTTLPHLCLITAFLTHYITLCTGMWYTIYFYCLFNKLNTLKKRNWKLIMEGDQNQIDKENEAFNKKRLNENFGLIARNAGGYTPKPILHFYLIGWGLPLLLCSIVLSISKRDYIQVPFNYCFTNQLNIIVGTILIPLACMLLIQLTFVIFIVVTLRRIVNNLSSDDANSQGNSNNEEEPVANEPAEDKAMLCNKWNAQNFTTSENDLKDGEMIEIKTDPITQRSVIITVNNEETNKSSLSTSFERQSDLSDSDRTSIMDTQYKPKVQLKFSLFCLFLFSFGWILAAMQLNSFIGSHLNWSEEARNDEIRISTYLFSMAIFIYSILQLIFYVLTRDDFSLLDQSDINRANRQRRLILFKSKVKSLFVKKRDEEALDQLDAKFVENDTNLKNWYFESKRQDLDNNETSKIDPLYQHKFYEKMPASSSNLPVINMNQNASGHLNESDNDEHKKSICDVIFSSRKEPNEPKVVEHSPSTCSLHSSDSVEPVEMNSNESELRVKKFELNSSVSPYFNPTLAVQEETEDSTMQLLSNRSNLEESAKKENEPKPTKRQHIRNPSLLAGTKEQSMHVFNVVNNGSPLKKENIYGVQKATPSSASKRPVYVFVDYSYEEKIYQKLVTSKSAPMPVAMAAESPKVNNGSSHKMRDVGNKCTTQIGTAIESLGNLNHYKLSINACANSNGLSSMTGSSVSSNVSSSNTNRLNSQQELIDCDDNIYQLTKLSGKQVVSSNPNVWQNSTTSSALSSEATRSQQAIIKYPTMKPTVTSLSQSSNHSTTTTSSMSSSSATLPFKRSGNLPNSLLIAKHETSV